MSAEGSSQTTADGEDWFQPGTHSLWLYDRKGEGTPALLAVYAWEIAGLRGVYIEGAWGDLHELKASKGEWDVDYTMLHDEVMEQQQLHSLAFAELVATGHMHRIGAMPPTEGFTESPIGFEQRALSDVQADTD